MRRRLALVVLTAAVIAGIVAAARGAVASVDAAEAGPRESAFAAGFAPVDAAAARLQTDDRRDGGSPRSPNQRHAISVVLGALAAMSLLGNPYALRMVPARRPQEAPWRRRCSRAPPPFRVLTV